MNEWDSSEWQRNNGWAAAGDIVIFLGKNGHNNEPKMAMDKGLVVGQKYKVVRTNIDHSYSYYEIEGFEDKFNCVMFDPVLFLPDSPNTMI